MIYSLYQPFFMKDQDTDTEGSRLPGIFVSLSSNLNKGASVSLDCAFR